MRQFIRLLGVTLLTAGLSSPASAQLPGGQQGGGQQGGGQQGGGQQGGGMQGGGQGSAQPSQNAFQLTEIPQAPQITPPGTTGGRAGAGGVQTSNILANYYANPLYQGILANALSNAAPGGFGTALYPATGGTGGAGGVRGAAGGAAGAFGARGAQGANNAANQSGTLVQLPVQISYQAVARFPMNPIPAAQLQSDVAGLISRNPEIANATGISVTTSGSIVTLRGAVKDADEAKMIAGMVRMMPGVRQVKAEMTFPRP